MELNFKDLSIEDKELVTDLLGQNKSGNADEISCEKLFGTLFSWRFAHPVMFAECDKGIVFGYRWENRCLFMIKQPDIEAFDKSVATLLDNCSNDFITIINMTETEAEFLKQKYNIEYIYDIKYSDYIYDSESFRTYSGKKLHSKKNKLNKFMSLYGNNYEFKEITPSVIDDCLLLLDEWKNDNGELNKSGVKEIVAAEQLLVNYFNLNLYGYCLYINKKPIGFTIGEGLFKDTENSTLIIHCEKATYDYEGAYPALAHFFALKHPEFKYINREDDTGDLGLRQSKRSYNPLFQLHKDIAIIDKEKFNHQSR